MGEKYESAWLPLTPRGVGLFAHVPTRRLLLVQFVIALLAGATVAWFFYWGCFPTVNKAIEQLPPEGEIRSATLNWKGRSPQVLGEGTFLALAVDLDHTGGLRSPAHMQVEFGRNNYRIRSLFGGMDGYYPIGWVIAFNRTDLKPLWGAWRPTLLTVAVTGTALGLMLCWWLLATAYAPAVLIAGFYTNRDLNFVRSWRLAGAALMPGAVIMIATILFFSFGIMDLVGLMFFFCAHLVAGWIYLFLSLLFVPKIRQATKNPFAGGSR